MADEIIGEFLSTMYGEAEGRVSVWWREQPGSKSPYNKSVWFSWPEDRDKMAEFIQGIADKDVCITTATYNLEHRTPEHTKDTQVIWMDSDVCAGENYRVEPSWTVATSSGRWQHFWMLTDPVTAFQASEISHKMAIAHAKAGADPSSWPANKIMRVPGTMNTSHGFPTRVKGTNNGLVYTYAEVAEAYADVEIPQRALVREIPELSVDELPAYGNVTAKLNADLLELALTEPHEDQDRSRLRYKLLLELFRAGLSYEEVLSVAWHAPASRKWSEEDPRGLAGLASEAVKAQLEAGAPSDVPSDPFPENVDDLTELALDQPVVLLTDEERKRIEDNPSFIDWYNRFSRQRMSHDNDAYDRACAWTLLSMAYMDTGYIPFDEAPMSLNLYIMLMGDTTTGKTTSLRQLRTILREYFHHDPEFNLGGDASEVALVKRLHDRDGKPSFFNSDEAAGTLNTWITKEWSGGMKERIAELYDGEVGPLQRSGRGESINKTSKSLFTVFLAGTQRGIMEHITTELFQSGLIPRFVFAVGKPRRADYSAFVRKMGDGSTVTQGFDPAHRQIAARLKSNRDYIRERADGAAPIMFSNEALTKMADVASSLDAEYRQHPLYELIGPSIVRWTNNVYKAAALLAMDARRTEVSDIDMLHALAAGEEWMTNLLRVIGGLSATKHERACNEIYRFVASKGGRVTERALYKRFGAYSTFEMENYLKSLHRQGRVVPHAERSLNYYLTDTYLERL